MDPLVNVDGVFPSYYFVDGRAPLLLLAAFLCGSHLSDAERTAHTSDADLAPSPSPAHCKPHNSHIHIQKLKPNLHPTPGAAPVAGFTQQLPSTTDALVPSPCEEQEAHPRLLEPLALTSASWTAPSPLPLQGPPGAQLSPSRDAHDGARPTPSRANSTGRVPVP